MSNIDNVVPMSSMYKFDMRGGGEKLDIIRQAFHLFYHMLPNQKISPINYFFSGILGNNIIFKTGKWGESSKENYTPPPEFFSQSDNLFYFLIVFLKKSNLS